MTPTGRKSGQPGTFANRYAQQAKTNYFLPLQCNKKTVKNVDAGSRQAPKISAPTIEMFLRIRPALEKNYFILNSKTLLTFLPFEDKFTRNSRCAKSSEAEGRRHAFTKIFGLETSQAEMFEGSIKHRVAEFVGGKSSTIMTYGMRDSGKTYTLFGTSTSPGIITRSIGLVFSAINCTVAPWYKPTFQGTVRCLNETARASETQRKTRVLNGRSTDVKQTSAEARKFLDKILEDSWSGNVDLDSEESLYAVWLSFAEIYNGNVYDLLDDAETRSPLRLYVNTEGRTYVCGLQKVHALTALEACQILMTGQSRVSTIAKSSRSHTIFTIELLRYRKNHAPEEVVLSTLTFCDLAGSTHFEKSHVREASSINNSLMVLGRCLKAVSQNQMAPFRQSKLTRICQPALSGEENLSIIVNVFRSNLSDEAQSIFNFYDTDRKLIVKLRANLYEECKQLCDFERIIRDLDTCGSNIVASTHRSSSETAEMTGCMDSTECKNIREQNRRLKQELEAKNDMLSCENTIRQQLTDHYLHIIEELKATYKANTKKIEIEGHDDLLKWSAKQIENFCKECIDNLMRHKKRKRDDSGDYIEDNHTLYEELEIENAQVTSKVAVLKEAMKKLRKENETILYEKNKCCFELALITEELKKFRQLTRAGIRKLGGNSEDIENDADCLMNNLEQLMDEKVQRIEKKLDEMNEYIRAMENKDAESFWSVSEAEQESSKSEDVLNDALSKVKHLEEELLSKEACIVRLQRHAQLQERQLVEVKQCLADTKNKNISDGKDKCDRSTNISYVDYTAYSFFQDKTPVKSSSRMCVTSSIIEQQNFEEIREYFPFCYDVEFDENIDSKSLFESNGNMDCSASRSSDRNSREKQNFEEIREYIPMCYNVEFDENVDGKSLFENNGNMDCSASRSSDKNSREQQNFEEIKEYISMCYDVEFDENIDGKSLFESNGNMDCSASRSSDRNSREQQKFEEIKEYVPMCYDVEFDENIDGKSLFENNGNMDYNISRSSDRNSRDDSGISSELQNESQRSTSVSDNINICKNEDKCTQTGVIDDSQIEVEGNVEQIYCANSNKWHTLRVIKLPHDLEETIQNVFYAEKEAAFLNEYQLLHKKALKRFTEIKSEIAIKRDTLVKKIKEVMQKYKDIIDELFCELADKEENENRISERLQICIERSRAFENKLSLMQDQLDNAFRKCTNKHLPKIESLEKEVLQKTLQINELNGKISKIQHEFAKGYELFQKIHNFEIIVNRCRRNKNDLYRQLYECSETQLTLVDKLKKLTMKIEERESEVILLKSEVHNLADLNVANNEKARNLDKYIFEVRDKYLYSITRDLYFSEKMRKKVENNMKVEIHNFRTQLSEHKNNTTLLNEICKTYSDSQDEITYLKMQLEHKELETTVLRTNRDATIKKYEILMRHFQNDIEEKYKHFKTLANSSDNLKRSSTENQRQLEEILKDHEAENSFTSNSCFVLKHANSETLNVSSAPNEVSTIFSDEKDGIDIKFGDNESCQADSNIKSNVQLPLYETDSSEMENMFNIPITEEERNLLNRMRVRRLSGKIAQFSAKYTDDNSDFRN